MAHLIHMVMDGQWGSTGKGAIIGYLAKRGNYDTAICAFSVNAGHSTKDASIGLDVMVQQIPTAALCSETVKTVLIGPGSAIHAPTLMDEIEKYAHLLKGKRIMIHPHAIAIEEYHTQQEIDWGMAKIGSTVHGVGAAMIERVRRNPEDPVTVGSRWVGTEMEQYVCTMEEYREAINAAEEVIIEGAQGFCLSIYHGAYPYTTSRDVTPWQIAADCGLPYSWASYIQIIVSLRCFPIRVNNRTGSSGPCYDDQLELAWEHFADLGVAPEITTVTKLQRRIFTFSRKQIMHAIHHIAGYWDTKVFLNFANYTHSEAELEEIIAKIETPEHGYINGPKVAWFGLGPDDADVVTRAEARL